MDALFSTASADSTRSWLGSLVLLPVCVVILMGAGAAGGLGALPALLGTSSALLGAAAQEVFGARVSAGGAALGGFVLQLLLPSVLFAFFARYRFCFGMQVFLVLLGHNLLYLGRFETGTPGWSTLLDVLGLGAHDYLLGSTCVVLGAVVLFVAVILPALTDD